MAWPVRSLAGAARIARVLGGRCASWPGCSAREPHGARAAGALLRRTRDPPGHCSRGRRWARPAEDDAALAQELAAAMSAELRPDGTIVRRRGADHLARPRAARSGPRRRPDPALARLLAWLMGRQGQPGRLRRGMRQGPPCAAALRALGPRLLLAGTEQRCGWHRSPCRTARRSGPSRRRASRSAAWALRAALRAGLGDRPGHAQHLESLRLLAEQWTELERLLRAGRDGRGTARPGLGRTPRRRRCRAARRAGRGAPGTRRPLAERRPLRHARGAATPPGSKRPAPRSAGRCPLWPSASGRTAPSARWPSRSAP